MGEEGWQAGRSFVEAETVVAVDIDDALDSIATALSRLAEAIEELQEYFPT
jgi:hypothetical protein